MCGFGPSASMLTPSFAQVRGMLGRRATGEALADVGRSYNLSHSTISRLLRSGMFALVRVLVCVFVTAPVSDTAYGTLKAAHRPMQGC